MLPLDVLISFLVSLAANGATSRVQDADRRALDEALKDRESLREALSAWRSLPDELSAACTRLARDRGRLGVPPHEAPLWRLLGDDAFQGDLDVWFVAGGLPEGAPARERLVAAMDRALTEGRASQEQRAFLCERYFDTLEREFFANPELAAWRHDASLNWLRGQVAELRRIAEEKAGIYSPEKQKDALDRYCALALRQWDIIDLTNLPQEDVDIATQALLLRQLYQPLRVTVEAGGRGAEALSRLEARRESWRQWEAGRAEAEPEAPDSDHRVPVGARLATSSRLVVLGDPGAGKTTLLRWMATAYLLRYRRDDAVRHLPDIASLPEIPWIPVLIRCRELGTDDLSHCFSDYLGQHLKRSDLQPAEAEVMCAVILDRIARGEVLLLVDGLDEITDMRVRVLFCKELEQIAARYPAAPILVTSRVVGYRDMPYRMGSDFEHCIVAPLSPADKDDFARRWVQATDRNLSTTDQEARLTDLRSALHSSDRIERLASNPMMLTTLVLVKRKVGKLPSRRTKLYREAVGVLLNWNPGLYDVIEEEEAVPQLEYVAYEMCRRGVQQLKEEEILDLLDRVRVDCKNLRAVSRRSSEAFLAHIEARSSLLIKAGGTWDRELARSYPVWEFRHLTFQEYLAARAMIDGRYPGREKGRPLAEQAGKLAGEVKKKSDHPSPGPRTLKGIMSVPDHAEVQVHESWRETLRLLVADCPDDHVDDVLLAILRPGEGEDPARMARPRAVEAALCLADEPNVSEETAVEVLGGLVGCVGKKENDGTGPFLNSLDIAAREVSGSIWASRLRRLLVEAFWKRPGAERERPGGVLGRLEVSGVSATKVDDLFARLDADDPMERCAAMLFLEKYAFKGLGPIPAGVVGRLFDALPEGGPLAHAAIWALFWLSARDGPGLVARPIWVPTNDEIATLVRQYATLDESDSRTLVLFQWTLANTASPSGHVRASGWLSVG